MLTVVLSYQISVAMPQFKFSIASGLRNMEAPITLWPVFPSVGKNNESPQSVS